MQNSFLYRLKLAYKTFKEGIDYSSAHIIIEMHDPLNKRTLLISQSTVRQNIKLNAFYDKRGYAGINEPRMLMADGKHFLKVRACI